MRQGLYISAALFLLTLLVMQVWFLDLLTPAIVSVAFTLLVCITIGVVWNYVAKNSPDSLPTFFTAVSGFRLLLALAVMFVYYLLDSNIPSSSQEYLIALDVKVSLHIFIL